MTDDKRPLPTGEHAKKQFEQLRPLLGLAGLFGGKVGTQAKELKRQFAEVERIQADQAAFAARFGPRGWTIFDRLSVDAVRAAVLEKNDDAADRSLAAYHLDPDTLQFLGYRFHVSRFEAWQELYERAVERAAAEDFLSAVPLVLIVIDGICTTKTQKHPFSGGADAPVFDTETTRPGGLPSGLSILGSTRRRLDPAPIDSPYRHGIVHGLNPNFGNALVAAKAFNLLQTMVDYFDKRDNEAARLARASEEQRERSWSEIAETAASTKDMQRRIDAWAARPVSSGTIAEHGQPHSLDAGSPEEAAAQYLDAVVARNFSKIAQFMIDYPLRPIAMRAGRHREELGELVVTDWRIIEVRDEAPAVSEVDVELQGTYQEGSWSGTQTIRVIFGDKKFETLVRGSPGGSWAVMPNFLNNLWGTAIGSLADRSA
ncbi:MAG: hypothetical protein JNL46_01310 [Sphingosinicella sp.]|nr:hypothetical protein [Sphingosinicella sp.]